MAGHYAAANVTAGRGLWEFRLEDGEGADLSAGSQLSLDIFSAGQVIDVQEEVSVKVLRRNKASSFQYAGCYACNSRSHRVLGSIVCVKRRSCI